MLKNYLVTIFRQIRKNRSFSVINIFGLVVAMSACLIIAHYVNFHNSFDSFHVNADHIFRIHRTATKNGVDVGTTAKSSAMIAPTLAETNPHVQNFTRFYDLSYQNNSLVLKTEEGIISFEEEGVYGTDPSTFELFDFVFLGGSSKKFSEPNKLIITASTSKKYFDSVDEAVGETIALSTNNGKSNFEIVGVIDDLPKNSHLKFNLLISMSTLKDSGISLDSWSSGSFYSYLMIDDVANKARIHQDMVDLYQKNAAKTLEEYGYVITSYSLMNIRDIHLKSEAQNDFSPPMDEMLVFGLLAIAVIILIIAWINYLNLSLVKTLERMKEVGIRKVLGSNSIEISTLFVIDALIHNLIAFLLALTVVQVFSPQVALLTGIPFNLSENLSIILSMIGLVIVGASLIGSYPSIMLKTLNTANVLLGNKKTRVSGGLRLRSILVTTQFIVTFLLISITLTVYQQINFMKSADLGFNKENIMVIKAPPGNVSDDSEEREDLMRFNAFKTELAKYSGIRAITNAGDIPGHPIDWGRNIYLANKTPEESVDTRLISMGKEFLDFFELSIVAGRGVMPGDDPWSNKDAFINEKMAEMLGFKNPEDAVGAKLSGFFVPLEVRGIVENHHHNSLHQDYQPIAYILSSWTEYYFVKFDIGDQLTPSQEQRSFADLVRFVESEWDKTYTDRPIDYFFLDRFYNLQYAEDEYFGKIFGLFSSLAIIIACLGLFGLTSFTLKQRTKEIGIRKVLGAGSGNLIMLLSKSYLLMIGIAYVISMPVAWIAMERWLEDYAFHIELGVWMLFIPLLLVLTVAIVTLISRLMITIRMNPVHSLRNE